MDDQTMGELLEERAYWSRLQRTMLERDGVEPRSDVGVGACLVSVEREIEARRASCGCELCLDRIAADA